VGWDTHASNRPAMENVQSILALVLASVWIGIWRLYSVLFLDVELELDATGYGGGYSQLFAREYSAYYTRLLESHTPSKSLILLLAMPIKIPEDHVPWLQA
jgi:hypothetical protein